jgi:GNAT superfamily N-acetyltransferase
VTGADGKQIDPALLEWYADADGVRIPDANLNESNKNPENRRIRDLENNRVLDGNGREVEFDPKYSPEADPRPDLHPDHEDGFWDANEVSDSEVQRDITDPQLAYEALFDGGFIEVSGEVALEAVTVAMEDRKYIGPDDNAIGRSGLARALSSALQGLPTSQANRLRRAINPAALNKERAQELLDFINSKSGDPLTPDEMKMLHRKYRNMGVDLTNMKMEGTSNYLNNNLGAERGKMPQLSTPEDQADFEAALGRLGIKFEPAVMTPDQLTPVQAEMDMGNVGMIMTSWLDPELRKKYKMDEQVLYVTRDGYVIDGHHRWASALLAQKKSGKPVELKCVVVDLDHEDALRICNEYNDHIGVTRQTLGATSADAKATPKRDVGGEVGRKGILPKDASPPVSSPPPEPPDEPSSGKPLARLPEGSPRPQSPPLPRMGETEFLDAEKPKTEKIPTFITPQAFDVNSPNFGRDFMPTNDNGSNPGLMPTPDQGKEFDAWLKQWEEGDQEVKKRISDRMAKKHGKDFAKRFIEINKLLNTKMVNITELKKMAIEDWVSGRNGAAEAKAEIWTTLNRQINRGEIEVSKAELQALFDEYKEDYFKNKWMSLQAIKDRAESGDKNSRAYLLLQGGLDAQNELRKNRREFDKLGRDLSIFSQEEYRRFMEESGVPMYDGDGSEVFEFNTTMYNQVTEKLPDGSEVTRVVEVNQGKDSGAKKAAERATLAALKRYPKWMIDALTEMAKKTPSGKIQIELDYAHHNDKNVDSRGFFNVVNGNLHIRLSVNNNDHGLLDYEETASHELGHALEAAIPEIRLAEWSLLTGRTRRVTQNGGVPISDYESVIPGQFGENGILDAFRNAYLTKSYDSPHPLSYTEVFTMTQERMQGGGSFTITNPHIFDAIELGEMTAEEALFGDNDTAMVLGLMIDGRDSDLKLHKEQLKRGAVQERGGFATTKSASPKVGMINETENLSNQESVGKSAKSQEVLSRIADDGEPQITENKDYGTVNVFQKGTYVTPNGKEYKLYFRETKVRHADGTYRITGGGVDITDGYDDVGDISFSEVGKVMNIDGKEVWDESSLPNWYSRNLYDVNNPFSTINYVEVVPEARRQGIATALLEFARKHSSAPIHHSWELLEDGKNFARAVQNSNNTMLEDFPDAPEIGLPDLYAGKSEKSKEVLSRIASQKEFQVEEFPANRAGVKQTRKSLSGTYTTPDGDKYKMNFQEKETFYEKNGNTVSDGGRVDIRTEDDFFVGYIEWNDAFGSDLDENGKQTWDKNWIAQELHDEVSGDSPFSYIKNIVVTDGFRRKGIATAMLEFGRMHSEQPIYHSRVRTDDGKEFSRAVQKSKKGEEDFPEFTKPVDPKDLTGDDITDLITDSPVTKKTVQHKRGRAGIGKLSGHGYRNPDLGGYKPLFDADGDVVYGKLYDRARGLGMSDKQADKLAVEQTTQIRDFIQRKNDKSRMRHLVDNAITPPEGAPESVVEQRKRWAETWKNNTKLVREKLSSALATGNVVEPIDKDKLIKIIKGGENFSGKGFLADDFSTGKSSLQTDFVAPHSSNQKMRTILSVRNEKHALKAKVVFKESVRDRTEYTVGDAFESGSFPQPLDSRDEEAMTMAGLMGNNNGAFISMTGMGAPTSENAQVETKTDGDLGLNDVKAIYVSGEDAVAEVRKALGDDYKNIDVIDVDHTEPFPENGKISFLVSPQSGLKYSPRELEQEIPDLKPEDGKRPISSKVAAVRKRLSTDQEPAVVETEERSYGDKVEHIKARGSYMTPNGDIIDLIFERKKTTNRDGEKSSDGTTITAFDDNYNLIALLEVTMADYTWDENNKQVFTLDGVDRVAHPEFIGEMESDTPLAGIAWISVNDDFQRQGIGTALLEFARDNYPDPIYHSDNLSPDGREYSLAVKKSQNLEEDIPDSPEKSSTNAQSNQNLSGLLDNVLTKEQRKANVKEMHDSINASGVSDEEIVYVSLMSSTYNLKEEELLPWEGKRSPGSIRLMGRQKTLGEYLDTAESNGRQYKTDDANIIKEFNKKYGEPDYKFGYREKAGVTYEQAKEFIEDRNSKDKFSKSYLYADSLQKDMASSLTEEYIGTYFSSWSNSSRDMYWQDAVKEAFNLENTLEFNTTGKADLARVYERDKGTKYANTRKKVDLAVVRAKYEETQKILKENGITGTVTLYKGVDRDPERWGITDIREVKDSVGIKGNPLNSWSDSKGVAGYFSRVVLKVEVPVERIFGTRSNGLGFTGKNGEGVDEREVVLMGGGELIGQAADIRNLSKENQVLFSPVKSSEEDIPDASPAPAGKPIPALVEDEAPSSEATAEAAEKAKAVREKAEQVEPEITKDVSSIAKALGGVLKSLEQRIKTSKSLARKIDKDAEDDYKGDRGEAALSISDAIRYTMVTNTKNYVQTIKEARERFLALGYKLENEKNFWKSDEYKGYTLKLVSPEGYAVEFQVHTDESYEIKEDLHELYKELRAIPKNESIPRQRQLRVELKRLADMIPVPDDESLFDIGTLIGDNKGKGGLTRRGKEFERA